MTQATIHKSMVHDILPETPIAIRAFVTGGQFRCPINRRTKSRSFESIRPYHIFKQI